MTKLSSVEQFDGWREALGLPPLKLEASSAKAETTTTPPNGGAAPGANESCEAAAATEKASGVTVKVEPKGPKEAAEAGVLPTSEAAAGDDAPVAMEVTPKLEVVEESVGAAS